MIPPRAACSFSLFNINYDFKINNTFLYISWAICSYIYINIIHTHILIMFTCVQEVSTIVGLEILISEWVYVEVLCPFISQLFSYLSPYIFITFISLYNRESYKVCVLIPHPILSHSLYLYIHLSPLFIISFPSHNHSKIFGKRHPYV